MLRTYVSLSRGCLRIVGRDSDGVVQSVGVHWTFLFLLCAAIALVAALLFIASRPRSREDESIQYWAELTRELRLENTSVSFRRAA